MAAAETEAAKRAKDPNTSMQRGTYFGTINKNDVKKDGDHAGASSFDADDVGRRLRESGKNVQIIESQTKQLQSIATAKAHDKEVAVETLRKLQKQLEEKDHQLEGIRQRYAKAKTEIEDKKKRAETLRATIQKSEKGLTGLLKDASTQMKRALYLNKEVSGNYAIAELAAHRGYHCTAGGQKADGSEVRSMAPPSGRASASFHTPRKRPTTRTSGLPAVADLGSVAV